jgi:hypothetical protein
VQEGKGPATEDEHEARMFLEEVLSMLNPQTRLDTLKLDTNSTGLQFHKLDFEDDVSCPKIKDSRSKEAAEMKEGVEAMEQTKVDGILFESDEGLKEMEQIEETVAENDAKTSQEDLVVQDNCEENLKSPKKRRIKLIKALAGLLQW